MSQIRVLAPGFLTTIQDLGRFGHAHEGISASGACDPLALRAANLLVGNAENAPALEITLAGPALEFESAAIISLTGSDFDTGLPLWAPVPIPAGQTIKLQATKSGARAYLAVRGGFHVPLVLGSASVHLQTAIGGKPLRAGDILNIGSAAVRKPRRPARDIPVAPRDAAIRCTDGPQASWFNGELFAAPYTVTEECNRMGIRLQGTAMTSPPGGMLTEGVVLGAIQVPAAGQPIILFVEHQTTGGYPKPANVISADFWRLGQLRPRDRVAFERVAIEQALRLLQKQEEWLYSL